MKRDFFAGYDWKGNSELDQFAQVQLMANALVTEKTEAQGKLKNWILQKKLDSYFKKQQQILQDLGLASEISLTSLPSFSFLFQAKLQLRKPYLSKDEQDFYIIDNPVRKDKVFKFPYVAPSTWKGSLRSALRMIQGFADEEQERNDSSMIRLFGPVKREQEKDQFRQGCLHFYPTFFDQISLEVINPHPRDTGAGKRPIYFESVPCEAEGTFTLLYFPFDRIGKDEAETRDQVAADLQFVAQGIKAMLTTYGFGAKTSSGFGLAEDELVEPGTLRIAAEGLELESNRESGLGSPTEPQVPDLVQQFWEDHPGEDFELKPDDWRDQHDASVKERNRYKEAKAAYLEYQEQLTAYQEAQTTTSEEDTGYEPEDYTEAPFESLSELESRAQQVADALRRVRNEW